MDEFDRSNASQTRVVSAVVSSAFSSITDSIIDPHSAIKVLAITVTAEIGAIAMFYVAKDKVIEYLSDSDSDVWVYGGVVVFLVGFLTAFAVYRLVGNKWPHTSARIMIWVVSFVAGILNTLFFFAVLSFEMK